MSDRTEGFRPAMVNPAIRDDVFAENLDWFGWGPRSRSEVQNDLNNVAQSLADALSSAGADTGAQLAAYGSATYAVFSLSKNWLVAMVAQMEGLESEIAAVQSEGAFGPDQWAFAVKELAKIRLQSARFYVYLARFMTSVSPDAINLSEYIRWMHPEPPAR